MATRKGALPANVLVLLGIFIAVLLLFLLFSGSAGGRLSNLLNPILGSISEPGRPDIAASISCVQGQPAADKISVSRLTITVRNSGEVRIKSPVAVRLTQAGSDGRVAYDPDYHPALTASLMDCLANGMAAKEVCPVTVSNAERGTYELTTDPANSIVEESETNNQDTTSCQGNTFEDCFASITVNLVYGSNQKFYCTDKCLFAGQQVGYNCGGCAEGYGTEITEADVLQSDPVCVSNCGCFCPDNSYLGQFKDASRPWLGQAKPGERCGRMLPDLVPLIDTPNSGRILNNGVKASSSSFVVCVDVKDGAGKAIRPTERVTFNKEIGVGNNDKGFNFQKAPADSVIGVFADCDNQVVEVNEDNNKATKSLEVLPDLVINYIGKKTITVTAISKAVTQKFTVCVDVAEPGKQAVRKEFEVSSFQQAFPPQSQTVAYSAAFGYVDNKGNAKDVPGGTAVTATADCTNLVREGDETNNANTKKF